MNKTKWVESFRKNLLYHSRRESGTFLQLSLQPGERGDPKIKHWGKIYLMRYSKDVDNCNSGARYERAVRVDLDHRYDCLCHNCRHEVSNWYRLVF